MTEVQAPPYPQKRTCPYEPPAGYQEIADAGPVLRVTLYDGRESWIVTGYKESREILTHPNLSSQRTHPGFPIVAPRFKSPIARNLVLEVDGRYRMPTEIRRAIVGTTKDVDRQRYAVQAIPALLKFHTDQIGHRPGVLVWFHDEERSLRPLFDPENYLDEELLTEVMRYLPEIADALEAWYVREQQSSGLLAVNQGLHVLADRAHLPDLAALTAIRMATAHRMADRLGEANEM
ncbi:hypothetical protein ACFQ1S_30230, partial [Kibdelosporangium lantanae]